MKCLKRFHHIGYAVNDIKASAKLYIEAEWKLSETIVENTQKTQIAFLTKEGFPTIELVSKLNEKSPIDNILNNNGVSPYHICYEVDDIIEAIEELYEEGFKPLFMPVESNAMNNWKICYLFHSDIGYIEITAPK